MFVALLNAFSYEDKRCFKAWLTYVKGTSQRNCLSQFLCDVPFTYVNQALKEQSYIDHVLVSSLEDISGFSVLDPVVNFSDHLPLSFSVVCLVSRDQQADSERDVYVCVRQDSIFHVGIRQMSMPIIIIVAPVLFH